MIGIGNWGCHVDTMFFKGDVKFTITDNGGEYGFELHMDGPIPEFQIKEIKGKTMTHYMRSPMLRCCPARISTLR